MTNIALDIIPIHKTTIIAYYLNSLITTTNVSWAK